MNPITDQDRYHLIKDRGAARSFNAGDIIAMQGEPVRSVGYILSGRAKAVSYSEAGLSTWVGHFAAGAFFGHTSLLAQSPANFEISADTDMDVVIISVKAMQDMLNDDNDLSRVLIDDLALRLDMMTQRLIEAFTLSAKGRVCAELARLSNVIGLSPGKNIIRPNPILVDVAMRVNSTRETVSRTVSELQKKGIISREPGAMIVDSPDRLKAAIR